MVSGSTVIKSTLDFTLCHLRTLLVLAGLPELEQRSLEVAKTVR